MSADAPVLLYDGTCGFCNASVQFIIARDRRRTMRFAPLQSDIGQQVIERHPELKGVDSVVYVDAIGDGAREAVSVRSTAALAVCRYLGAPWSWAGIARIVPARLRDLGYDLFARHRYRFFGRHEACMLPPRDVRDRFIGEF
jgi:predicted DCC family thiol-disulfide oxidoreductase YuxK